VYQKSTDPGCKELHGLYYRYGRNGEFYSLQLGELIEPVPHVVGPHLDALDGDDESAPADCQKLPFINMAEVEPAIGDARTIRFWDEPKMMMPLYYDSKDGTKTITEQSTLLSLQEAMGRETCYALCGVGGSLKFIAAVAACSKEANFSYVVFEKLVFSMEFAAAANLRLKTVKPGVPFDNPKDLGIPKIKCWKRDPLRPVDPPCDARDAGMETYGPVAIDHDNTYRWKSRQTLSLSQKVVLPQTVPSQPKPKAAWAFSPKPKQGEGEGPKRPGFSGSARPGTS
jgi:hypothetical protein